MIKISTVCISKNCEDLVEETIASFALQNFSNKEIIFIDNLSVDNTVEQIKKSCKKYKIKNYFLLSEKDKGISDAMNKGWELSKGEIINFLHFGDKYYANDVFSNVLEEFKKSKFDFFAGAANYNSGLKNSFIYYPKIIDKIYFTNTFAHMAVFFKRTVKDKLGLYNPNLLMVMDYDYWFRGFKLKCNFSYTSQIFVKLLFAGESSKTTSVLKDFYKCKINHYNSSNNFVEKLLIVISFFIICLKVIRYDFKNKL